MNRERLHEPSPTGLRLIEAIKSHIPHLMAKHSTPGLNIALADHGRLIWEAGYGWADIAQAKPMTPDTTYRSGSLSKVYTATAVMILVDRGLINLNDPINRYLPFAVKNPLGDQEITIHDLMVHKSGLSPDADGVVWEPGPPLEETLRAQYAVDFSMLGGRKRPRWLHPVGALWMYSNLGVATLGLIVERANGEGLPFSEFVQREVMDPLGMTLSQFPTAPHTDHVRADIWERASTGYARMGLVDIPSFPVCIGEFPAGGIMARPADHIRLLLAMMNGGALDGYRLLNQVTARAMLTPATTLVRSAPEQQAILGDFTGEQGLIWRLNDFDKPYASFEHGGGHMYGWRTQGRAWPRHGAAVMVAMNQWSLPDETGETQEILDFIGSWLRYRAPVESDAESMLDPSSLSYARGALLAAAYRIALNMPGDPPPEQKRSVFQGCRSRGKDWDGAAFQRGFEAVFALEPKAEAVSAFWSSSACEINAETVLAAHRALGGRTPSFMSAVLPTPERA